MADTLDKRSAEGQDAAVGKAFQDAEKDVYEYEGKTYPRTRRRRSSRCCGAATSTAWSQASARGRSRRRRCVRRERSVVA